MVPLKYRGKRVTHSSRSSRRHRKYPKRTKRRREPSPSDSDSSTETDTSDESYYPSSDDYESESEYETDDEEMPHANDRDGCYDKDAPNAVPFLMLIGDGTPKSKKKTKEEAGFELRNPEYKRYFDNEKAYYNELSEEKKINIDNIEKRIKELNEKTGEQPRRFAILQSDMDDKDKAIVINKLNQLDVMRPNDSEYHKLAAWMDAVQKIPFGKYKSLPITAEATRNDIKNLLTTTKNNLDNKVYGHNEVKDHIVCILAQWISNPTGKGIIIGIQGDAGVGKTTLIKKGICNSLDLPFVFVPLGGMADRTELVGSSYVYEGSRWGRISDSLMKCGYMNPVFFFDELDKVSDTKHGEDIINILMQLTDSSQNDKFHDVYFNDFEFDLSRSIMIFAYNDETKINPILRDRMIKINTKGYKTSDKLCIANKHLIPEILTDFNLPLTKIVFSDTIIRSIIEYVDEEQGVRNLKRALHDIISNLHMLMLIGDIPEDDIQVTHEHVHKFVHKTKNDIVSHLMIYS
jgi:ATP-dependent Lon protease